MPTRNLETLNKTVWHYLDRIQNKVEQEILGNYRAALEDIRNQLGKLFRKYSLEGKLTKAEMTRYNRLMGMQKQITDILGPQLSKNGVLIDKLSEVKYEESFYRHAWALDQSTGVALRWGLLNEKMIEAAVKNELTELAKTGLKQEALIGIRRTITQGLIKGSSYPQMAKDLKDFLDRSASGYLRIARTEGNRAAVQGQIDNYDRAGEKGITIKRIWDATLDDRTRPDHGRMDGKAADEDGKFHVPWPPYFVDGPGEGPADMVINCRCRVRAEVGELAPKLRRIRDEGIQPYQTYDEWVKKNGIVRNRYGQRIE